jgi:hypothetical protein
MAVGFKLDKSWQRLQQALGPSQTDALFKKHLKKASQLNGKLAEVRIRDTIKKGGFKPNRPLTMMIKHKGLPLTGYESGAQLRNSITSQLMDEQTVFVGVLKQADVYNIAVALHEGVVIRVTPAMRGLFYVLWLVSVGAKPESELDGRAKELWDRTKGGWKPLSKGTVALYIPPRPFIKQAFADKSLRNKAKQNWQKALQAAFRELAKKARE